MRLLLLLVNVGLASTFTTHIFTPIANSASTSLSSSAAGASFSSTPINSKKKSKTNPSLIEKLSNPLYLPWNKAALQQRNAKLLRKEGALLYRQLGISEDATYEEVNAAYDSLVLKYKGDVKAKTRLSVTRDKVFELRLKQRVDGSLKISAEARDMDMLSDRMAEMNSKNAKFVAPKWTAGLMVIPDKAHATSVGKFVGGTAFGCVMMPKMASTFLMMGWAASVGLLYSRGQPELVKDDMGNPGEVRPTSATAVLLTLALVTGFGAVFAVMGSLIGTIGGRLLPPGLAVQLVCHVGFFVAAAFFKTYQGDGSTGGKKKWGKNKGK